MHRRIRILAAGLAVALGLAAAAAAPAEAGSSGTRSFSTVLVSSHHYAVRACTENGQWYVQGTKRLRKKVFVFFRYSITDYGQQIGYGQSSLYKHSALDQPEGSYGSPSAVLTFRARFTPIHGHRKLGHRTRVVTFGSIAPC